MSDFGLIWRPFHEYLQIKNFFKNPVLPLFYLHSPLASCKKSEKSLQPFLKKQRYQSTNQPANYHQQHRFYRTLLTPVQKNNQEQMTMRKEFEVNIYRFKVHNTQLKRRQSTRHYGPEIQFYYQNLQNIDIFTNLWRRFSLLKLAYYLSSRVIFSNL